MPYILLFAKDEESSSSDGDGEEGETNQFNEGEGDDFGRGEHYDPQSLHSYLDVETSDRESEGIMYKFTSNLAINVSIYSFIIILSITFSLLSTLQHYS